MADDPEANAASILSRAASCLSNSSTSTSTSTSSSASPASAGVDATKELRTSFPHHLASSSSSNPPAPGRVCKRTRSFTPKRKEVIRKFVCLADKDQCETPNVAKSRILLVSGLGECKMSVREEALENEIRSMLINQFPKLNDAGGFELMYCEPRKRHLRIIPPGPNGLSMKYIVSFVGQGRIFIRPIQTDLPLVEGPLYQPQKNMENMETCRKCWASVDVGSLREHCSTCSADPDCCEHDGNLNIPTLSSNDTQGNTRAHELDPKANVSQASTSQTGLDPNASVQTDAYNQYISIIDDVQVESDDDDPEFIAAVEASLKDQDDTILFPCPEDTESLSDIFKKFVTANLQNQSDNISNIVISRKSILPSTLRAIDRKTFSFFHPLIVTFAGEEGVDEGGPKREFFRLLMVALRGSSVFQGPWLSHDLNLLSSNKYAELGKLIAWSVLQGGNGPRCLSEEGYNIIRGCEFDKGAAIQAVCDADMKPVLMALDAATTEREFSECKIKYSDAIAQYGYSRIYTSNLDNKEDIINCLLKQYFIYGVHIEFMQLLNGMNSVGNFGDIMMAHKSVFDAVLGNKQEKLTASKFKSLYKVDYAEKGSNMRNKEESTMYCFEVFLVDLEEKEADGVVLEDLLIFITGVEAPPPLGFDSLITIQFYDFLGKERRCPSSSTCCLSLNLPRGMEDPDEFKNLMRDSILQSHGFGKG